jgi:2-polyprenyl-3-methyl-5-hydroxy-6-metoxy-1,4-benzoquinol methylase
MIPGMADPHGAEHIRLEQIAADSWYEEPVNAASIQYSGEIFARHLTGRGGSCLELGPAEGVMTQTLGRLFTSLTLVDGSEQFCAELRRRYPNARVVHSLFEDFDPGHQFNAIVLGHVLEHVEDPRSLLAAARGWLAADGVLFAAVPNARSLHRQAAVLMGLLAEEHELNDTDRHHGHRRVYDPESLCADVRAAGLRIRTFGGYWIKPLSNAQIDETFTPEMIRAFMVLGERYPDVAAEIYVVATR